MSSTKVIGKTIGEVEKLTGIPKRKLKYMIERNLIHLSQRSESGFWLYNEQDIQTARTIMLLQQLGYSEKGIRTFLIAPASQWPEALEQQIAWLTLRRGSIEDQLFLAELLRYRNCIPADAAELFSAADDKLPAWNPGEKEAFCRFLYQVFSEAAPGTPLHELSLLTDRSPDDPVVQVQVWRLCDLLWQRKNLSSARLLLIFRLAHTLSGLVPVLDALLSAEGFVQFITTALQSYCERL